jgi:hypothetical protein
LPDIFNYDIVVAFGLPGCPLCRALAIDERRWMTSFWREGKDGPETRRRFFAAGGFCQRHAWLLHRLVAAEGAGAAIADVYGVLAERDLKWLGSLVQSLGSKRRGRQRNLRRSELCPGCVWFADAVHRKAAFFTEAITEGRVRRSYVDSDGLCFEHLAEVVDRLPPGDDGTRGFLIDDWRRRLRDVAEQLAEYDRKRDHRYADEPKGREQQSWTEVILRYVGDDGETQ